MLDIGVPVWQYVVAQQLLPLAKDDDGDYCDLNKRLEIEGRVVEWLI